MTKEQFLEVIKLPEILMNLWHEYFIESTGKQMDFEDFEYVFSVMLWNGHVVKGSDGVPKRIDFKASVDKFYDYYKRKFKLWEYAIHDS